MPAAIDLTGHRYGKLKVLELRKYKNRSGEKIWLCACDCGAEKDVAQNNLRSGHTTSCGVCIRFFKESLVGNVYGILTVKSEYYKYTRNVNRKRCICQCQCGNEHDVEADSLKSGNTSSCGKCINDLIGKRFSRLLVISEGECVKASDGKFVRKMWNCLCDCGKQTTVSTGNLQSEHIKSCGCLRVDTSKEVHTIHGKYGSYENKTWARLLRRCTNPNDISYSGYGGRGISVCERWSTFENFLEDVGYRPSKKHSIERIDVNGNYEPTNVKWATASEQARNKRNSVRFYLNGQEWNLRQYCELHNLNYGTISSRIHRGKTVEEAIKKSCGPFSEKKSSFKVSLTGHINSMKKRRGFDRDGDDLTAEQALEILKNQGYRCVYFNECGNAHDENNHLTMDHKVPKSKGGYDTKSNIQWLCRSCNSRKAANEHPTFIEV